MYFDRFYISSLAFLVLRLLSEDMTGFYDKQKLWLALGFYHLFFSSMALIFTSLKIVDARDLDECLGFQAPYWYSLQCIRYSFVHQSIQMFRRFSLVIE
jgi:hypothetical protein